MRPLDPRLLRYARSTRGFLVASIVIGVLVALLVIAQARLLSSVVVQVTSQAATWADVSSLVVALAAIFAARALLAWAVEAAAVRASAGAKQQLREAAIDHVLELGPAGPGGTDPAGTATLITRGVDALDGYYARYLPQLVLAVIVPVAVLLTVLGQDILSTVIIAVTLPLIPVFMALIGLYTKSRVDKQWTTLQALSGHFLDLVSGLPTLKAFGRAKSQAQAIRSIGDRYRSTTMGVLRVSFLSSLVLELLATLSVALVAVSVGLRLAEGQMQYSVALFVLVLAPEAYLPLRLVGQHFHAAAEGLGAADRLFTILESPLPAGGSAVLAAGQVTLRVDAVTYAYPDRSEPADSPAGPAEPQRLEPALAPVTFTARPGTVTAIVGTSGGGKSTLLSALLGFVEPTSGTIVASSGADTADLRTMDCAAWRTRVAWLPQRARLVDAGLEAEPTIADVVRLGRPDASDEQVWAALASAGLKDEIAARPDGLHARLGADGSGLSVGQAQRLAMARAIVTQADVYLLDEPTAALDVRSEQAVVDAVRALSAAGATVIVVAHRPALIEVAHQVVRVERPVHEEVGA